MIIIIIIIIIIIYIYIYIYLYICAPYILRMMEQEIICKGKTRYIKLSLKDEFLMTLMKFRSAGRLGLVAI